MPKEKIISSAANGLIMAIPFLIVGSILALVIGMVSGAISAIFSPAVWLLWAVLVIYGLAYAGKEMDELSTLLPGIFSLLFVAGTVSAFLPSIASFIGWANLSSVSTFVQLIVTIIATAGVMGQMGLTKRMPKV